jgi:hypothetical protein
MNTIYSTLALLVSSTSVQAQDTSVHQSNAGIKGGYNLAAVRFDGSGETGQRNGFHIGVYSHSLVKAFYQPELLYSQQGYEIKDANGTFTKLDYINLPILLKAYPSKISLEAGPQIGLAISKREEYDGLFSSSQEYNPNNFDWGMNFGGGFKTDSGIA